MPGITVNGGSVEAQGETVQKILIDGREFFGNDVATAIKTLPAEAVKSVEVFDKLSDQAEFRASTTATATRRSTLSPTTR